MAGCLCHGATFCPDEICVGFDDDVPIFVRRDSPEGIAFAAIVAVDPRDARITALEAENAELKARNAELIEGLRPFAVECNEWVEQVHLLPDETVPEIKAPSDDAVAAARFTLGDLRRARGLLQGGPDA